jgi:uncharacterized protein (TIGR00369 family)
MTRPAIHLPRYAESIGIVLDHWEGDRPILAFDFNDRVSGHTGLFHGGALAGLLEMAAIAALQAGLPNAGGEQRFKPINITVEYLRGAGERRTYAVGEVVRLGRRLANIRARAWQEDPEKPVATGFINVKLSPS